MSDLGPMGTGFADAVQQSQAIFRCVLDAMARPGTCHEIPEMPYAPPPLNEASTAIALTLLDDSTPVWLDPIADTVPVREFLAFHCGCPIVGAPNDGSFAIVAGTVPPLEAFNPGSDEFPENSTTIIAQVETVQSGDVIALSGPGIDGIAAISDPGLSENFWLQKAELELLYPCGIDLILTAQHRLTCMPRSVQRVLPDATPSNQGADN